MIEVGQDALRLVERALEEDVGDGDRTTCWTVSEDARAEGVVVAKAAGVVAGLELAEAVFRRLDPEAEVVREAGDGTPVASGDRVLVVRAAARAVLTGERVALNFLQRLSGIATATRRYVDAVAGTGVRILDTRKTTPGWRALEKAAVRAGGGASHRCGLFDMVLVKENHIAAAGGIAEAVDRVRAGNAAGLPVEVEVTTLDELEEVLRAGVDRVLLDNMDPSTLYRAVDRARAWAQRAGLARPELEASGNVTIDSVRRIAESGVDLISVGALTHSAPALDLSMRVRPA